MPLGPIDADFARDPLAFANKNALSPGDYASASAAAITLYDKTRRDSRMDDLMTIERRARQIAYTQLESIGGASYRDRKNAYRLVFHAKEKVPGDLTSYIPVWFLPWMPDRMTSMRIPPKIPPRPGQTPVLNSDSDPDIFFTAAINGCSVIVHGDPKSPTISHGGTQSNRSTGVGLTDDLTPFAHGSARQHWSGVHAAAFRNAGGYGATKGISAGDYVNRMGTKTTPEALEYQKFLKDNGTRDLRMNQLMAEGCVFGLRDPREIGPSTCRRTSS